MDDDEETIVINDLLSFLSCKYKAWPFETLLEEVKGFYKDEEIIQSYHTLRESIQESYELSENVSSSEEALQSIHGCFLNFNKNELPVFVCRNLENIPDLTVVKNEQMDQETNSLHIEKTLSENYSFMKGKITEVVFAVNELSEELRSFATKVTTLAGKSKVTQKDSNQKNDRCYLKGRRQTKKKNLNLSYLGNFIDEKDKNKQSSKCESYEYGEDGLSSGDEEEFSATIIDAQKLGVNEEFPLVNSKIDFEQNDSSKSHSDGERITKKRNPDSELANQKVLHIKSDNESADEVASMQSDTPEEERTEQADLIYAPFLSLEDSNQSIEETSIEDEELYDNKSELTHKKYLGSIENCNSKHSKEVEESTLYSCSLCSFSNKNREVVEIHLLSHSGEESSISKWEKYDEASDNAIQCLLCLQEFSSRTLLNNHTKWCPAVVNKRQDYQPEEKHSCSICGIYFGALSSLISHKSYHDEVKPFECSVCGYRFYTQENLNQHFQVHLRPRFQCPYCLHGCTSQFKLNKHVHIHTGYRPFECHLCCFQAEDSALLNEHLTGHTDVNMFPCDVCGKFFETRRLLTSHKTKHPNRNPLICPRCGKEFKQLSRLKKHCVEKCPA